MSNVKTGVGTHDMILGLILGGRDTAHNTTYYSESGGGHRTRKCAQMFTLVLGRHREFKDRGGGHRTKSK